MKHSGMSSIKIEYGTLVKPQVAKGAPELLRVKSAFMPLHPP
jgi:hypothetical protein